MKKASEELVTRTKPSDPDKPDSSLITIVETSQGFLYCNIPESDVRKLHDMYEANPTKRLNITGIDFLFGVSHRIYTEWCMGEARGNFYAHKNYQGEGFTSYIREETHHELVRRGYEWDEGQGRFGNLSDDERDAVRDDVLKGFVRYAIEFFERNEEGWQELISTEEGREMLERKGHITIPYDEKGRWEYVPIGDPRNIRGSLENYMDILRGL